MRLRGAISGFGEVAAAAHLAGWRMRPDVQIVAVHDPLAPRRHLAINLVPNIRVYDDIELMLDGEALDTGVSCDRRPNRSRGRRSCASRKATVP